MFEDELKSIEARLKMPYPERAAFLDELAADLEETFARYRREGCGEDEARRRALDEVRLSAEDLAGLDEVHEPAVSRALGRLPAPWGRLIEDIGGLVPLMAFTLFIVKEVAVIEFLREGGPSFVVAIFLVGGFGVAIELQRAWRWLVLRDHSKTSLETMTSSSLYLAVASFLIGVIGTAAGYRLVFVRWAAGGQPDSVFLAGLAEPLSALIVATAFAGVIVLLHGWLVGWRARSVGRTG